MGEIKQPEVVIKNPHAADAHFTNGGVVGNGDVIVNGNVKDDLGKGGGEKTEEKEKDAPQPVVGIGELFQFATCLDIFFMVMGSIAAVGNGIAQPCSFIVFGELINKFIEEEIQQNTGIPNANRIDLNKEMEFFAAVYCYVALAALICGYFQNMLWSMSSIRQAFVIRKAAYKAILRQDIGWFDTTDSGELSTRMADDITKIQEGIGDKIGNMQQAIFMLVAGFVIGFVYGWKLTLVILATSPALIISAYITGRVISVLTSQEQTAYAQAGAVAEEVFSAIRTVVAFGGEEKEIVRYKSRLLNAEKAGIKKGLSTGFAFGLFNAVIFGSCALGFWYGGKLVIAKEMEGGDLLIVFFSVLIGAAQFGQVGPNVESFARARGAAHFIYQVIHRQPVIDSFSEKGTTPTINGVVDFKDCYFNYPSRPDIPIMQGLSLNIPNGSTVALVGESGCGKSTTIKLIQRFYDITSGQVLIDGHDIRDLNVAYLRKHIGVVSQEPVLFESSIRDNILMGNKDATEDMIVKATKDANAYNFIKELPQQFNTMVGEGGAQLSGGQKQRIAIARALVRDPKILLLDEATSALDTESESIVQAALDQASQGRTTVIIAHRLSTVRKANLIAVVDKGRIIETGSHDELMAAKGAYYKLVILQTMVETEEDDDVVSIHDDEEKEAKLQKKLIRSMSIISGSEVDEKAIQEVLLRRKSTKKILPVDRKQSVATTQVEKKEEEIIEEEPVNMPSMLRVMKMNLSEWPFMVFGVCFACGAGAMPVGFAIILAEVLDSFAKSDLAEMKKDTEFWSLMFFIMGLGIGICYLVGEFLFAVAGERLTTRLREMAFRSLLRQEIGFFDDPKHSTGALTARLASDASGVKGATSSRLNTLTQVLVMGLSSIIIAFYYSWKLTLLICAFVPLLAFAGAVQTKLNTSFAEEEKKKLSEAGGIATESIMQIRTVASIGQELYFYDKFCDTLSKPFRESKKSAHYFGLSFGFSMAIMFFCNAACFRLGGYLNRYDGLELEEMMKVIIAVQFGAMTAGQIASFAPDYIKAKVSAGRIFSIFDRVPPIDTYSKAGVKDVAVSGSLEFKEVEFRYPNRMDVQVLDGLNLEIKPGQQIAFVGASGCGKSTSVSLIERFYNVTGGSVHLDGKPIKDYNVKWLRSQLGIVQQEPVLFDRTITDNILYGIEDQDTIDHSEVERACEKANIHHFIMNLPQGYNTKVGEKGTLISGGQKQRMAIARALIRNPKILLLDEATSALDSESEKIVQEALDVAMVGRTSIIIAHRLSTIQHADTIAVIKDGKIVELGKHNELVEKQGAYYALCQAQL